MEEIGSRSFERAGITGIDIAAIMGVLKARTAMDVYLKNTVSYEDKDKGGRSELKENNEEYYWIQNFKEIYAQEYSIRSKKKTRRDNKVVRDDEHEFMIGNGDRKIVGENAILLCKTENMFLNGQWNGEKLPESYVLEAEHNMKVYKADKCIIASLIGGKKFIYREIKRDEDIINMIVKIEKDFWINNILKGIPPKEDYLL